MRYANRGAEPARSGADDHAESFGPRLADRSCCCPARPVVKVLIPPVGTRTHTVDLLLCRHHYLASLAALAAANAVATDEAGSVLPSPSTVGAGRPAYTDAATRR
jgi:hypothetical protein